jgi:CubicO group peptidase (beta-lactamase class C family)
MITTHKHAALATLLAASCLNVAHPAFADGIDDYLHQEQVARGIPGLAIAIERHGRVERISTYGMANVETRSPVTEDSVFAIASLDKGITASGVVKAQQLGKLALTDPITKYVDVPLPGVTLANLLSHTSGLEDFDQVLAEQYGSRTFQSYTTENLLAAARNASHGAPGERYHYSDTGLFLAQLAIEHAVGRPWLEFMQDALFHPAGMQSVVTLAPGAIVPNRVSGYTFDDDGHLIRDNRTDVDYGPLYNDLGMTVGDFARWMILLDGHGTLAESGVRQMWTQALLNDGLPAREAYSFSGYGLGTGLDDVLGQKVVMHTGHSGVAYVKFPALDLGVVVFTNLEHPHGSDPAGLALAVAGMIEPSLSLQALKPGTNEPAAGHTLRAAYAKFLAGVPDLTAYAPQLRDTMWDNRETFTGRRPRLGELRSWQFLRRSVVDGETALLYRAMHEHGQVYVRYSLDAQGRITRLVWWHL